VTVLGCELEDPTQPREHLADGGGGRASVEHESLVLRQSCHVERDEGLIDQVAEVLPSAQAYLSRVGCARVAEWVRQGPRTSPSRGVAGRLVAQVRTT
jgi:hypothetical protein